jgi:hypothetical protein
MMRDHKPGDDVGLRGRLRSTGLIAPPLLMVVLATACAGGSNGPSVAGPGSSSTASPSPSRDPGEALLAFSRCMRDNGISDFPDPEPGFGIALESGGGIAIVGEPDLDQDTPQFKAAEKACKSLLPPPQLPCDEQQQQELAQMLEFAKCMREHGFPSFPDPKPDEGFPPHRHWQASRARGNQPTIPGSQQGVRRPGRGRHEHVDHVCLGVVMSEFGLRDADPEPESGSRRPYVRALARGHAR